MELCMWEIFVSLAHCGCMYYFVGKKSKFEHNFLFLIKAIRKDLAKENILSCIWEGPNKQEKSLD